jgi:hypothetical protein
MTPEERIKLFREQSSKKEAILISKGSDYATTDVLSNFKRLSEMSSILNLDTRTPEGYALFMVLMKLDRICNLLTSNKTPSNESVEDSFNDMDNYSFLAQCILKEKL